MKMFFLTAWLWKGWSRWCLQPHNHKINGRSSKLWSEPTADSGGNRPVHSFIFIFGRNIVAAFRKQYGHVKRQKPSYLFPVLLYIWNSSFRRSVETLIAKTVSSNWNFFPFFLFFIFQRKFLVILRASVGYPVQCYVPNSKGFGVHCMIKGWFVNLAVKQTGAIFFMMMMMMILTVYLWPLLAS